LAQHTPDDDIDTSNYINTNEEGQEGGKTRVHAAQLISEVADASEDNRDDLQL